VQAIKPGVIAIMLLSTALVAVGVGLGWWLYGRRQITADEPDALATLQPDIFTLLRRKFLIDEIYDKTVVRLNAGLSRALHWLDVMIWGGVVALIGYVTVGVAWINQVFDEYVINLGFNKSCESVRWSARLLSFFQNGQVQRYLRVIGLAVTVFAVIFIWGCRG
jgi:NADH-quinone oxidoreductase subunit L